MITLDKKFILSFLVMMGLFSFIQPTNAKGVYQTEEDFLKEVFIGKVPDKKKINSKSEPKRAYRESFEASLLGNEN